MPVQASPSSPPEESGSGVAAVVQLASRWAELAGALALYPDGNSRVLEAGSRLEGARVAFAGGGELALVYRGSRLLVNAFSAEVKPGTKLEWLRRRFWSAALEGVELTSDARPDDVAAFTRRLVELYAPGAGAACEFSTAWAEELHGVRPIERRFRGTFDGGRAESGGLGRLPRGERGLLDAVLGDDEVREHLRRMGEDAERAAAEEGAQGLSAEELLERIVALLPADVAADEERAIGVARRTLAELAEGSAGDPLARLAARVGHRFFVRPVDRPAPALPARPGLAPDEVQRETRPEDLFPVRVDTADVEERLRALPRLARPARGGLDERLESPAEELAVYLHVYAREERPRSLPALGRGLRALLRQPTPRVLEVLGEFLRDDDPRTEAGRGRLVRFLRRRGTAGLLARAGVVDPAWAVREFPDEFLDFAEALELGGEAGRRTLAAVVDAVGPERVAAAGEELRADGRLLADGLVEAAFAGDGPGLLALTRLIVEAGGEPLKARLVEALRAAAPRARDRELLDVVREPEWLSREYLFLAAEGAEDERVRYQRQTTLCRFLRAAEGRDDLLERRVRAVELLEEYPSVAVLKLLEGIVDGTRLGLLKAHPWSLRRAAKAALRAFSDPTGLDDV